MSSGRQAGWLAGMPTVPSLTVTVLRHPRAPVLQVWSSHAHWGRGVNAPGCAPAANPSVP